MALDMDPPLRGLLPWGARTPLHAAPCLLWTVPMPQPRSAWPLWPLADVAGRCFPRRDASCAVSRQVKGDSRPVHVLCLHTSSPGRTVRE